MFSAGEIEEQMAEFHGYLDEKNEAFQKINQLLGEGL